MGKKNFDDVLDAAVDGAIHSVIIQAEKLSKQLVLATFGVENRFGDRYESRYEEEWSKLIEKRIAENRSDFTTKLDAIIEAELSNPKTMKLVQREVEKGVRAALADMASNAAYEELSQQIGERVQKLVEEQVALNDEKLRAKVTEVLQKRSKTTEDDDRPHWR